MMRPEDVDWYDARCIAYLELGTTKGAAEVRAYEDFLMGKRDMEAER